MKRSPLKRKTPLKGGSSLKRTPLRPVSKKRRGELKEYSVLRKVYLATFPKCWCCPNPATDIHHRHGRFKDRLNDTTFWIGVCRPCHDKIHSNPAWAYENRLLVQR